MASSFDAYADRIAVIQNDHVVFDTARRSVCLIPAARLYVPGTVTFPDLLKANAYAYNKAGLNEVCDSFITLLPQEWGPGRANHLPSTPVGTVPAGVDYLDVRVRLTRTSHPSQVLGVTVQPMLQQGAWVNCPGGSCPLEASSWVRGFEVVLSGTSILLNRYQSVRQQVSVPWRGDNAEFEGGGAPAAGWTHGAAGSQAAAASSAPSQYGLLVSKRDSKPVGSAANMNRTGSGRCSIADNTNYGAVYAIELDITPGRIS